MPYFAPATDLPAILPTTAEIENSKEILHERTAAKVVSIGPHFIAKYGFNISLEEGRTMMFVRRSTAVPVPRVYALYSELGKNYIIMERFHTSTLEQLWNELSVPEKHDIAMQMKTHMQSLRKLPSPRRYCSLDNKPLRDSLFWVEHDSEPSDFAGPFSSESDLVDAIVRKCKLSALNEKADFYDINLPEIFRNHEPVFTHGDLQRKNIMVKFEPHSHISLVLLDWESAGWYPSFWEYAQTLRGCLLFEDDWHRWIPEFLDQFRTEYAWLYMLQSEIDY